MRTLERWESVVRSHQMNGLTPRIIRDLQNIPVPEYVLTSKIESLALWGATETGKTILAVQILMEERKRIYLNGGPHDQFEYCVFVPYDVLISEIKACFNEGSEKTDQDVINYYSNVHLLVLDDFGSQKTTDWVLSVMYSIINHRYEYFKKTIITLNKSLKEIAEDLNDDRITSRMERSGSVMHKKSWK